MARDLRALFAKERKEKTYSMKEGHEHRFSALLDSEMPVNPKVKKFNGFFWMKIAASVIITIALGTYFFSQKRSAGVIEETEVVEKTSKENNNQGISLGDLSPDLKKIESFYVANINLELSALEFNDENKAIVDGYMERLSELDKAYHNLNEELNNIGPNDQTINALIKNLQLRLQLLQKLKSKLNQLKSSKNGQQQSNII